jgi:hypothetical protein
VSGYIYVDPNGEKWQTNGTSGIGVYIATTSSPQARLPITIPSGAKLISVATASIAPASQQAITALTKPVMQNGEFLPFGVTVTNGVQPLPGAIKGVGATSMLPLIAGIGAVAAGEKIDYSRFILPLGVVIGGYFLLSNLPNIFKNVFTAPSTSSNNNTVNNAGNVDATIKQLQDAGEIQTISTAEAGGIANQIWSIGSGSELTTGQQDQIRYLVIKANTTLDLLHIIKAFGIKNVNHSTFFINTCNLFGVNCEAVDLPSYVRLALSVTEIQGINDYLSAQNINYSF